MLIAAQPNLNKQTNSKETQISPTLKDQTLATLSKQTHKQQQPLKLLTSPNSEESTGTKLDSGEELSSEVEPIT